MTVPDVNPFFFEGGPTGCLLIHGFSGSPAEMRPMGEYLAAKGLTVRGVRLAGHGTTPEDMATTAWPDWVASAEEGLRELQSRCQTVYVAGLSMGGLISLHLAAHHPVSGVIAMSAPAGVADWRFRFLPLAQHFVRWAEANGEPDFTDQAAAELIFSYKKIPVRCAASLQQQLKTVRRELPGITARALVMQGKKDHTITPDSARIIHDELGSHEKELVWWPNSGHVITMDSEREAVWARAYQFISQTG
jgi:carboxylesterase